MLNYDPTSKDSILIYAQNLLGKSLRDLYANAFEENGGKGRMGQCVEKYHFKYNSNNDPNPDFPKAGVELKCTPLKELNDGSMTSKERLVLNIIDYVAEGNATFETSGFWKKNQWLLLMFYLHEAGVPVVDLIFKIVRLWNFPPIDLKIIHDDWNKLHWKISHGLAHEISEGDTLYLGACTKGSKAGKEMRKQYVENAPLAQQRAYSLKTKYMNMIVLDSLLHPEMCDNLYLSKKQKEKIRKQATEASNIVNSVEEYLPNETFEELVERKFKSFYGHTIYEIEATTGTHITSKVKAVSHATIRAILGVKTAKIKEFEKANLQQKSIRLEPNGNLKESMVFGQINYNEIITEGCWEDSVWYETLTQRFLFIVFRKDINGDPKSSVLEKVFFWTMPQSDLQLAKVFWADTKNKIANGDFSHFMKSSDGNICHVRPKARNAEDLMDTPFGPQKKKGYWLNRDYILNIVKNH